MLFLSAYDSIQNILQLIGIIIVFLIILAAAYAASVWVGKTQYNAYGSHDRNIKIIEVFRINGNQFLQIVQVGSRYFVIGVSKEHIEYLAELSEEDFHIHDTPDIRLPFQAVFEKVKTGLEKKKGTENK